MSLPWRIELAASPDTAPLFLSLSPTRARIRWTPAEPKAAVFQSRASAWDYAFANLPETVVRVTGPCVAGA